QTHDYEQRTDRCADNDHDQLHHGSLTDAGSHKARLHFVYDSSRRGACMKRHFRFFASASVGTVSLLIVALTAFTALSQQRATPALPGAPAPAGQAAPVAG